MLGKERPRLWCTDILGHCMGSSMKEGMTVGAEKGSRVGLVLLVE